jgi:multiple sugar transport system permease protein
MRARRIVLTGAAWLVALVFLAPYLQMLLTALKPARELFATPPAYLPHRWDLANFVDVWRSAPIATHLEVTLIVAVGSTLLVLAVSVPAAYYVARHRFRGRGAFLLLVLVTQMFAPTALVIGIYREFVALDLVNTYMALILVNAAFNLAFSIWILNGFFASIPVELEEAALLDGCSKLTALRRVTIPLAMPGVVTALIFTFIAAWNEFVVALTLSSTPDRQPLTVGITHFIGQYQVQWQYLFAASLIAILPVVVLFGLIERYLVGGLTAGSIK